MLHSDSLKYCHSKLLRYADDVVLGISYSSDQEGLDDDLSSLATCSADHGPIIMR